MGYRHRSNCREDNTIIDSATPIELYVDNGSTTIIKFPCYYYNSTTEAWDIPIDFESEEGEGYDGYYVEFYQEYDGLEGSAAISEADNEEHVIVATINADIEEALKKDVVTAFSVIARRSETVSSSTIYYYDVVCRGNLHIVHGPQRPASS